MSMIQHIYSITIQKDVGNTIFLKSFDKKIKDSDGKTVDSLNKTCVIDFGDEVQSISYVDSYETDDFKSMYEIWQSLTKKFQLSLEYVKEGYVFLLAFRQLHSGPDRPFNQRIIHNDVPRRRIRNKKRVDLKLRPAKDRDYGDIEDGGGTKPSAFTVEELIKTDWWLGRWNQRYEYLCKYLSDCVCGCVDYDTAREVFLYAFILTIAEIHMFLRDELPARVTHVRIRDYDCRTPIPYPDIRTIGEAVVNPNTEQYRIYIAPTLEGRAWILGPGGTAYIWDAPEQLSKIYRGAIGIYGAKYIIPSR